MTMRSWVTGLSLGAILVMSLVGASAAAQDATPSPVVLPTADEICAEATNAPTPADGLVLVVVPQGVEFDQIFIDLMIPHHESAVEMAILAAERGQHVEVREVAAAIIETQTAEIAQLRAWRDAWYPDAPVLSETEAIAALDAMMMESPGMGGMAGATEVLAPHDLAPLCMADSAEFDALFLEAMMPHHQGAVLLATEAQTRSQRPELVELAVAIEAAQQDEIIEMAAWLDAWYPDRHDDSTGGHGGHSGHGTMPDPTATP